MISSLLCWWGILRELIPGLRRQKYEDAVLLMTILIAISDGKNSIELRETSSRAREEIYIV